MSTCTKSKQLRSVVLSKIDSVKLNGNYFTADAFESLAEQINKYNISGKSFMCTTYGQGWSASKDNADMAQLITIDLRYATHIVENVKVVDGALIGDVRILNTPYGEQFAQAVEDGKEIRYTLRGVVFELKRDEETAADLINKFHLVSIDVVF